MALAKGMKNGELGSHLPDSCPHSPGCPSAPCSTPADMLWGFIPEKQVRRNATVGKSRQMRAREPQERHSSASPVTFIPLTCNVHPLTCNPVMDTRLDSTVGRRGSRGEECGDVTGE